MEFNSGNPTLNENTFSRADRYSGRAMTLNGTVNKTGVLLLLMIVSGSLTWDWATSDPAKALGYGLGGALVGVLASIALYFKMDWAPVVAPIYALAEGLLLGAISAYYQQRFHGIVLQAAGLTVAVLFVMLFLYRTRIIQPTQRFVMGLTAALGGLALLFIVNMVLGFFGHSLPFVFGNGPFAIGFSILVIVLAALCLIMDFGLIENGIDQGAPAYMEWYAGFALLVTLIWLYVRILRLLAQLQSRRD